MNPIMAGRYTTHSDEPFILFLIGMRINRWWRVDQWGPVASEMPPMLQTLYQHPEKGFLGGYSALSWPTIVQVQYWRSFDQLEQFARNVDDPHAAAWQRFYKKVGKSGNVGIWHETYQINPGQYENIYVNMTKFGLGSVFERVPASGRTNSARQRRHEFEAKMPIAA